MSIWPGQHGTPNMGLRLEPKPPAEDGAKFSGFDALGHKVPFFRRSAADLTLKQIGITDAERRLGCVGRMSNCIERDDPHGALEVAHEYVDVTGAYRLLSVLLTAEDTHAPAQT